MAPPKKLVEAIVAGAALISIVDDDPWVRGELETFLAAVGYGVRSFKSAETFVESSRGCGLRRTLFAAAHCEVHFGVQAEHG